jgi:hypothetical protein
MASFSAPLQRHGAPAGYDSGLRPVDLSGHGGHDHDHSHSDHSHDHGDHGSYYSTREPSPSKPQITYASLGLSGLPLPSSARRNNPRLFFRRSVFKPLADAIRTIAADTTTRKILIFLVLNLSFCGVEALYGLITNSLGLFTDAIHMGFDSTAIAMGLAASVIGKWQKDERWSFGCVSLFVEVTFSVSTRDEVHVGRGFPSTCHLRRYQNIAFSVKEGINIDWNAS